jgi:hypothetical protein
MKALKLAQVGRVPGQQPLAPERNGTSTATTVTSARPRPPPPPRPNLPARPASVAPVIHNTVGNQPAQKNFEAASANGMDGISRPALPPRTSTQDSGPQLLPRNASNSPALPPRNPSATPSPALPPRRPSQTPSNTSRRPSDFQLSRRESSESISSVGTTRSSISGISNGTSITSRSDRCIKAPEYDPAALPALPPKRTQAEKDAQTMRDARQRPTGSYMPFMRQGSVPNVPVRPTARASSRTTITQSVPSKDGAIEEESIQQELTPALSVPISYAPPPPQRSALALGFNNSEARAPANPSLSTPVANGHPPPIPTSSRPNLSALQASRPANGLQAAPAVSSNSCLHCRDFSGPDQHATRFPRESIPSYDVGWLSQQLTAPFASPTDKARVIFTWLHHNVAYDVVAFFNNNVRGSTPQDTIRTGLAVCQGYAGMILLFPQFPAFLHTDVLLDTFVALALKAGLQASVLSGASKGYGHRELKPGQPIPPYQGSHAWAVCRIDGGVWKLIDPCVSVPCATESSSSTVLIHVQWGAGTVNGPNEPYKKGFAPQRFTQSNNEFGLDHWPEGGKQQYREDGRSISWEEFITGNKAGSGASM